MGRLSSLGHDKNELPTHRATLNGQSSDLPPVLDNGGGVVSEGEKNREERNSHSSLIKPGVEKQLTVNANPPKSGPNVAPTLCGMKRNEVETLNDYLSTLGANGGCLK